jgi:hypothetical protein
MRSSRKPHRPSRARRVFRRAELLVLGLVMTGVALVAERILLRAVKREPFAPR